VGRQVTVGTTEARADTPRVRLMAGLAQSVAEKGYAAVTIADVVGHARVSKRTFYEHFADKEACLVAMYEYASDHLVAVLRAASAPDRPWPERIRASATAYLTALEALPAVNRTLLLEMQAAGARAFEMRIRKQQRFAEVLSELVDEARTRDPELRPLSPALALAVVGGINELLLHAANPYTGGERPFTPLVDTVVELVSAVLTYRPEVRPRGPVGSPPA
jgi:AcrR family transcriptional regulator